MASHQLYTQGLYELADEIAQLGHIRSYQSKNGNENTETESCYTIKKHPKKNECCIEGCESSVTTIPGYKKFHRCTHHIKCACGCGKKISKERLDSVAGERAKLTIECQRNIERRKML